MQEGAIPLLHPNNYQFRDRRKELETDKNHDLRIRKYMQASLRAEEE